MAGAWLKNKIKLAAYIFLLSIIFLQTSNANTGDYLTYSKKQSSESKFQSFVFDLQFNEPRTSLISLNTLTNKYYYTEEIGQKIHFIKGILLKNLNRPTEMLAAFEEAVKQKDVLADYALMELARYNFDAKRYDASYKYALELLDNYTESLLVADALILCARIQTIKKNSNNAISFLDLLPKKIESPERAFNAAELYFSNNNHRKALEYYKLTLALNHNNSYKQRSVKKINEIMTKNIVQFNFREKIENITELTKELYSTENYNDAIELINTLPACAEKYYFAGLTHFRSDKFDRAAQNFKIIMDSYRNSRYWTKAIYYRYASGLKLGFDNISERGLKDFIKDYPYDEMTDNAYFSLAEYYFQKKRKTEALDLLKKIRTSYPNNDSYFPALWLEAEYYRKNNEYAKAADVLTLLIKMLSDKLTDRDEMVKALYWRAKTYETSGMFGNAARDFLDVTVKNPMSFYSYRSVSKLKTIYAKLVEERNRQSFSYNSYNSENNEIIRLIEKNLSNNKSYDENGRYSVTRDFREFDMRDIETEQFPIENYKNNFYKYFILKSLKLYDQAINELEYVMQVKENNPKFIYNLAHLHTESGNTRKAIEIVERMINKFGDRFSLSAMPRKLKVILYPQYYSDIVTFNASRNNVDPYLVFAIIREESRFRSMAVSRAGARGLMQIMPNTGKWIAGKIGMGHYRLADLFIPHINIKMGAWYFSHLTERNNNNLILSLASYNGGQGNVNNWIKQFEVDDIDEFVEKIPFNETRNYVKKVMTSYNIYKQIYDNGFNIELTSIETALSNERLK